MRDGRTHDGDRRPGIDLAAIRQRIRGVVEPAVVSAGLDLEDLTVSPAGRRLSVRVTVDGDDGVTHDELTEVSRDISARLDEAEEAAGELTPDAYTLEVSSPGVDRPLTLPRHWRRNVGRLVKTRVLGAGAPDRTLTGRITAVDDRGVTLDEGGRPLTVPFDGLGAGRVQVEFTRLADLDEVGDDDDLADEEFADDGDLTDDDLTDDDLADDQLADGELYDEDGEDSDPDDDEGAEPDLDLNGPQQKEDGS